MAQGLAKEPARVFYVQQALITQILLQRLKPSALRVLLVRTTQRWALHPLLLALCAFQEATLYPSRQHPSSLALSAPPEHMRPVRGPAF